MAAVAAADEEEEEEGVEEEEEERGHDGFRCHGGSCVKFRSLSINERRHAMSVVQANCFSPYWRPVNCFEYCSGDQIES